jgi:hypothetical protein
MTSDPYRSMVLIQPKQHYGLIQAPKPAKQHQCNKPMLSPFLRFFLFWLPTIRNNSLWRCIEYKKVYAAYVVQVPGGSDWLSSSIECWVENGGIE